MIVLLWSDVLIWSLVVAAVVLGGLSWRNPPLRAAWRRLGRSRPGMAAAANPYAVQPGMMAPGMMPGANPYAPAPAMQPGMMAPGMGDPAMMQPGMAPGMMP